MGNGASSELLLAENDRTFNALWVLGVEEGSFACECAGTNCCERLDLTLIETPRATMDSCSSPAGTWQFRRLDSPDPRGRPERGGD